MSVFTKFAILSLLILSLNLPVKADLKIRAEKGDPQAQLELGSKYFLGDGVPKNFVEAAKWLRKASDQGDASAQCLLGRLYDKGEGVPMDYMEALKLYRKAADQGNANAQLVVGTAYLTGKTVEKDLVEGYAYFCLASISWEDARKVLTQIEEGKILSPEQIAAGQNRAKELQAEIEKRQRNRLR